MALDAIFMRFADTDWRFSMVSSAASFSLPLSCSKYFHHYLLTFQLPSLIKSSANPNLRSKKTHQLTLLVHCTHSSPFKELFYSNHVNLPPFKSLWCVIGLVSSRFLHSSSFFSKSIKSEKFEIGVWMNLWGWNTSIKWIFISCSSMK